MGFVPAPPVFQPMLAVSGPIYGHEDDYAFEPKWDGWRALVSVHDGHVAVRTRTGRVVTAAVPELGDLADDVGDHSVVLDGELVAHQGTPASFYRLGPRMATRRPGCARQSGACALANSNLAGRTRHERVFGYTGPRDLGRVRLRSVAG